MSWETRVTETPCFCGRGKIVQTYRSDDWGRSENSEEMHCPECSTRYVLAQIRGRDDRPMRWVTREQYERIEVARLAAAREHEAAIERAREELGERFIAALSALRARKRIWDQLRDAGLGSRAMWSFAKFNRTVRARGLGEALRLFIDDTNAQAIRAWLDERLHGDDT